MEWFGLINREVCFDLSYQPGEDSQVWSPGSFYLPLCHMWPQFPHSAHGPGWVLQLQPSHLHSRQQEGEKGQEKKRAPSLPQTLYKSWLRSHWPEFNHKGGWEIPSLAQLKFTVCTIDEEEGYRCWEQLMVSNFILQRRMLRHREVKDLG